MEKSITQISATKKSRFSAGRRMMRSHIASLVCISLSSLLIISINIFELLPSVEQYMTDGVHVPMSLVTYRSVASVVSIILSTVVLVMSVIVFGLNYNVKSENFHSCGVELAKLQDKARIMEQGGKPSDSELKELSDEYHNILRCHNLNHRTIDYRYAIACNEMLDNKLSEKDKMMTRAENRRIRISWNICNDSMLYWLFLLVEIIGVAVLLGWRISLIK